MKEKNAPFFPDREVIILSRSGVWIADGVEITHAPTRRLFARSLKRDDQGYFLQIGRETKRITVEDTPYFILRVDGTPSTRITLTLNDETHEPLNPGTLHYSNGRLTCAVKNGAFEARFLSAPYYDLLSHLEEDENGYFLRFGNQCARLQ